MYDVPFFLLEKNELFSHMMAGSQEALETAKTEKRKLSTIKIINVNIF